MLSCQDVNVLYRQGSVLIHPLRSVSFQVAREPVAIMGPSGSGKSTLLRVLAGLQIPDSGKVTLEEVLIGGGGRGGKGDARVSLIHQDYRLVEFLTVTENLALAAELRAVEASETDLVAALKRVGLSGFGERYPATLSGGEQQRVAIARTLVTRCQVLLADEPTGALDEENSRVVARLLRDISQERQMCVVVGTHDRTVARTMSRTLMLRDGQLHDIAVEPS